MKNSGSGHTLLRAYFSFTDVLEKIIEWLSAVAFFIILVSTLLQVFFRYVLNAPLLWPEEAARYLGIFMVLIVTSNALKRNAHIGVDILSSKLPAFFQKPLKVFAYMVSTGVMGFMGIHALDLTQRNFFIPTPALRIPIGIPYTAMTVAFFVAAFTALCMTIETVFNIKQDKVAAKETDVEEAK
ncbi:MAG: TRAP transporter small permease [Spirochaetes bacterium]|nr:TRAP transporter small permease [Spirochaetota bacterium]